MKIEVEITEEELYEATHRAIKKAIVDSLTDGYRVNGKFRTKIEAALDTLLPNIIMKSVNDSDISKLINTAVEKKATSILKSMVK